LKSQGAQIIDLEKIYLGMRWGSKVRRRYTYFAPDWRFIYSQISGFIRQFTLVVLGKATLAQTFKI